MKKVKKLKKGEVRKVRGLRLVGGEVSSRGEKGRKGRKKGDFIREIIKDFGYGLTTGEIQSLLKERFSLDLNRRSISKSFQSLLRGNSLPKYLIPEVIFSDLLTLRDLIKRLGKESLKEIIEIYEK